MEDVDAEGVSEKLNVLVTARETVAVQVPVALLETLQDPVAVGRGVALSETLDDGVAERLQEIERECDPVAACVPLLVRVGEWVELAVELGLKLLE